jgi:hypothetical protein
VLRESGLRQFAARVLGGGRSGDTALGLAQTG